MRIIVTEKATGKKWYYPYTENNLKSLEFLPRDAWTVEIE